MLQKLILEVLTEEEKEDISKIKGGTMSGGAFVAGGTKQRSIADPEVDNQERNIVNQIDKFLLALAALEGVELEQHRMLLQRVLKLVQSKIQPKTQEKAGQK